MSEQHSFNRTTCACEQCRACCKRQPGSLASGDLERIQDYLGLQDDEVKDWFWASPGALVKDSLTGRVQRVGTITPRFKKGRCVFLDKDERCTIHQVAPFGCSHFDTHMEPSFAQSRSLWLVHTQMQPEYQALRNKLPYAQSYRPTKY